MESLMTTPIIKNSTGETVVNSGHLVLLAVGAVALYLMVPQRKRKNLFK